MTVALLFVLAVLVVVLGTGVLLLGTVLGLWLLAKAIWAGIRALARQPEYAAEAGDPENAIDTVVFSTADWGI